MTTKCILIIDEEKNQSTTIKAALEKKESWLVLIAASGKEGSLVVQSRPLDGILVDLSISEIDKSVLFNTLQHSPDTQQIPIILLTTKVQKINLNQFVNLNVAGIISKPLEFLKLAEQVAKILDWL
ncbi:MAG: response regulator [Scytonema sp. PMC 1070.18]|nr:response regulator [Scytonema sp. PMC 1070.18]